MPQFKLIRKGVTPSVSEVPTSTIAVMMPMTLSRVGKEAASQNEELTKVEDVNDAFAKFKPELNFKGNAGPNGTEFQAEFAFRSIEDFDPENLQKQQEARDEDGNITGYSRNDIADLKWNIDLLYRLKDRWRLPTVRRAWNGRTQRADIPGDNPARELLKDIFSDLHPGFIVEACSVDSVFTPPKAVEFLNLWTDLETLFEAPGTYEQTVAKLQEQIDSAEAMREQLVGQVFQQIRPIERSYREIRLFFKRSNVMDSKVRKPVEMYVLNADASAMKDVFSMNIAAVENFIRKRNDYLNLHDHIVNLVVPGPVAQTVRAKLEDLANVWGIVLLTDVEDEKNSAHLERNCPPSGKYEFLRHTFDAEYVAKLRNRDRGTEKHFFRYFDELMSLKLRSRLPSSQLIEDVKQETFLRVLTTLRREGGLERPGALGAYINTVCNNILFETYRNQSRFTTGVRERVAPEPDPETELDQERQRETVREAISELGERDQDILRWLYFEERDKDEICRHFKVDREYLRVLLFRARKRFRIAYLGEQKKGKQPKTKWDLTSLGGSRQNL